MSSEQRWTTIARGATRRCPRCGQTGLFRRWFTMVDDCPRCGLHFEREEGYWLGAMALNLTAAMVAFVSVLVAMSVAFWPDVPWVAVLVVGILVSLTVPLVLYPFSKTMWVAGDLIARRADERSSRGSGKRPRDR